MNMLDKLYALNHPAMCGVDESGICDCGLTAMRGAVRELVEAVGEAEGWCEHDSSPCWHELLQRRSAALEPFL